MDKYHIINNNMYPVLSSAMDVAECSTDIKLNPWAVESLEAFLFFCCPECPDRSLTREAFINHALVEHPQVKFTLIFKCIVNKKLFLSLFFRQEN
jgi:hypothetical protein